MIRTNQATAKGREATTLLATFYLQDTLFALDAAAVQEVIRLGTVTPVRHSPSEVTGVINLRGKIVTLLDTSLMLGYGQAVHSRESRVFLVEDQGEFLGLLVDRVGDVIEIERDRGHALPVNIPPGQARFLTGVYRTAGRVVTLINTSRLLAHAKG